MKIKNFFRTFLLLYTAAICFLTSCGGNKPVITQSTTMSTQKTTAASTATTNINVTPGAKKRVAITFDDGPHNVWSKAVANELAKYGFHATFFVVGNRIGGANREYDGSATVEYLFQNGHEIGIHGYTHLKHYDDCTDAEYEYELNETIQAIKEFCSGYHPALMRPIGGIISEERVKNSPYSIITWSLDSFDYKYKEKENDTEADKSDKINTIVENVMSGVKDGDIILMHDIYENTYEAVKIILERLHAEGYEVVTVSELLGEPQPGTRYSHR